MNFNHARETFPEVTRARVTNLHSLQLQINMDSTFLKSGLRDAVLISPTQVRFKRIRISSTDNTLTHARWQVCTQPIIDSRTSDKDLGSAAKNEDLTYLLCPDACFFWTSSFQPGWTKSLRTWKWKNVRFEDFMVISLHDCVQNFNDFI